MKNQFILNDCVVWRRYERCSVLIFTILEGKVTSEVPQSHQGFSLCSVIDYDITMTSLYNTIALLPVQHA